VNGYVFMICLNNIVLASTLVLPSSSGGQALRTYSNLLILVTALTCFSSGGKTGAVTIDSDRDYEVAINAVSKKNIDSCQVGVEFDTDLMEGFHIKKRVSCQFSLLLHSRLILSSFLALATGRE